MKTINRDFDSEITLEEVNDYFTPEQLVINEKEAFEVLWTYLTIKCNHSSGTVFKDCVIWKKTDRIMRSIFEIDVSEPIANILYKVRKELSSTTKNIDKYLKEFKEVKNDNQLQ